MNPNPSPSHSSPLLPLSAPVGVSGVTLTAPSIREALETTVSALEYERDYGGASLDQAIETARKALGYPEDYTAASPVDSVGVPAFRVLEGLTRRMQPDAFAHAEELYGIIMSEGTGFALDVYAAKGMPMEQFKATLSAFAGNAASHAANLAKIKALEAALRDLLESVECALGISDYDCKDSLRDAEKAGELQAARAALALPSA